MDKSHKSLHRPYELTGYVLKCNKLRVQCAHRPCWISLIKGGARAINSPHPCIIMTCSATSCLISVRATKRWANNL